MTYRYTLFCALCIALIGCEPQDLISNASVDRWCGDHPCGWEVDGEVERVATWHSNDYAVVLVSDDARLHQLNQGASSASIECMAFEMLARVEHGAKAYLELDFLDDGEIDYSERLPEGDFIPVRFLVTMPTWFEGVRFSIRKDGPGEVTLARLAASPAYDCPDPPLPLLHRPSGATCEEDEQCEIGNCTSGVCDECGSDDDCDADQSCGEVIYYYGFLPLANVGRACVDIGSKRIAELCDRGAECASGV